MTEEELKRYDEAYQRMCEEAQEAYAEWAGWVRPFAPAAVATSTKEK